MKTYRRTNVPLSKLAAHPQISLASALRLPLIARPLAVLHQRRSHTVFSGNADIFFKAPSDPPSLSGRFGVLYLLRRDILICLGTDPDSGHRLQHSTIWPGAMAVLAGIDLLGKFHRGKDTRGKVGDRFKEFVRTYFQLSSVDADQVLYQLRNSLLHSFGLYSENRGQVYRFRVTATGGTLIESTENDIYLIDLRSLHSEFENAIELYKEELDATPRLQGNFADMFPKYGTIEIG